MRIGILADIHEEVEALEEGIDLLRRAGVERLVVLGDLFDNGKRIMETVDVLARAGVVGVWGNHDLGLCHEPEQGFLVRYPARVFDFLRTLSPRMEVDGCLFSHGLPNWDAFDPVAYYMEERPESESGRSGSFAASPCRVTFVGHFHRWLAATPEGILPWDVGQTITLDLGKRHLVVIAAVCDGWCATYDTTSGRLAPINIPGWAGDPGPGGD